MSLQTLAEHGYREPYGSDSFIEHEYTEKELWLVIDGTCGIEMIPQDVASILEIPIGEECCIDELSKEDQKTVADHYSGEVWTVKIQEGYGARLSAPGYLDCTEWALYETEEKAREGLKEQYPDTFSEKIYRVHFQAYNGVGETLRKYFETKPEARKCIAEILRSRRNTGHTVIRSGNPYSFWDITEPEGSAMVPETAGTLIMVAIEVYPDF